MILMIENGTDDYDGEGKIQIHAAINFKWKRERVC